MILACDVGGTKTDVALLETEGDDVVVRQRATYASRDHAELYEIVTDFVGPRPPALIAAGFGVAGPVVAGRAQTTNLPWHVDGERLAHTLGLPHVSLMNDVVAQAWAVPLLREADQVVLQAGDEASTEGEETIAVIAAGTGLGYAALLRSRSTSVALASEGGHADFSSTDGFETDLRRSLSAVHGHVSVERVVSGPGLEEIYRHLLRRERAEPLPLVDGDPSAAVARAALTGRSALAERAVLAFLAAYGGEAGNWALRTLATGVWLGGGIAHKLLIGPADTAPDWRARACEAFLTRFSAKGRLGSRLATVPVTIITSDLAPLLGAAHCALAEYGR